MIDHAGIIPGTFTPLVRRDASSQAGLAALVGVRRA